MNKPSNKTHTGTRPSPHYAPLYLTLDPPWCRLPCGYTGRCWACGTGTAFWGEVIWSFEYFCVLRLTSSIAEFWDISHRHSNYMWVQQDHAWKCCLANVTFTWSICRYLSPFFLSCSFHNIKNMYVEIVSLLTKNFISSCLTRPFLTFAEVFQVHMYLIWILSSQISSLVQELSSYLII